MKFKIGDVVIKKTGGNKMTISNILSDKYECVWFNDKDILFKKPFDENDIVSLEEFKILLKEEERDDKIKKLLK